jgi:hypothetical protein
MIVLRFGGVTHFRTRLGTTSSSNLILRSPRIAIVGFGRRRVTAK